MTDECTSIITAFSISIPGTALSVALTELLLFTALPTVVVSKGLASSES